MDMVSFKLTHQSTKAMLILALGMVFFLACASISGTPTGALPTEEQTATPVAILAQTSIPAPTAAPTPQNFSPPLSLGPNPENFPAGYNPLTGQLVRDAGLLQIPAMLISISHFPAVARPQAGLSFAPWVFEFYITEGATRFLSVFYGAYPKPEIPISGDCQIRREPFTQISQILGNRVWLDENQNGSQEPYEKGVGSVCVNLYDDTGQRIESTTTDSNGYYGFNVQPGNYTVEFTLPRWFAFTTQNYGDENADSDPDPLSGRVDVKVETDQLFIDAGLILSNTPVPTPDGSTQMPIAEVGPVRSGRLLYADIAGFFQNSCLVYAFASDEVLEQLPRCAMVAHEDAGGGSMMPLERMQAVAEDNMRHTGGGFNYTSNLFTDTAPEGGVPANQINVFVALLNQSGWIYDPLYGSWLRFVDNADPAAAGVLHADIDRLTGRQLHFENYIIIFADVDVISPTNLDIHLEQGDGGPALLFRDGMKYEIRWSTKAGDYEKNTGQRRPIQFQNTDKSPVGLKPGSTWIFVASPFSVVSDEGGGKWKLRYYAPAGSN